jgi:hypothetical protein
MFNEKEKNSARKLIIKCFFYVVDFETIFIDSDVIITEMLWYFRFIEK